MNVFSAFDGMSCGRIALDKVGLTVDNYFSSEIKKYAIDIANKNYPQDKKNRLGDITTIKGSDLPTIDLFIGGSPCQDFSGANKNRLGVEGSKSGLFYEWLRLKNEVKPKYFLLENVRMKKDHQDIISKELGCEPIIINSMLFAPQLRHRLYWTNIPNNKPSLFLENGYTKRTQNGYWLQRNSNRLNDILENGWTERTHARCLLESDSRPLSTPIKMFHRYYSTGFTTLIFKSQKHFGECVFHYNENFKHMNAKQIDEHIKNSNIDLSIYEGVRYLTPQEREDCQTVPRGYTKGLTDNQIACILGDGWTIDVIAHIFNGLKEKDYATVSSIKKNNPKLYNAYIEREKAND